MADSHPEGVVPHRAGELIPLPAFLGSVLLALAGCAPPAPPAAAPYNPYGVPSEREQWELKRVIVQKKLDEALPPAMRNHGIDMWIVMDRENNKEPLHDEVGGGYPGVRGVYLFFDRGEEEGHREALLRLPRAAEHRHRAPPLRRDDLLRIPPRGSGAAPARRGGRARSAADRNQPLLHASGSRRAHPGAARVHRERHRARVLVADRLGGAAGAGLPAPQGPRGDRGLHPAPRVVRPLDEGGGSTSSFPARPPRPISTGSWSSGPATWDSRAARAGPTWPGSSARASSSRSRARTRSSRATSSASTAGSAISASRPT